MQVVYPALDSKVRNVTLAYTVEHEDEVSMLRRRRLRRSLSTRLRRCTHTSSGLVWPRCGAGLLQASRC